MAKISRNPQVAYQQGIALGRQLGLEDMFLTHCFVLLPAMYDAMPPRTMSDARFAEYAKNTELEIARILDEVFGGDVTQIKAITTGPEETLPDRVKYLLNKVNEMRKRCGMEPLGGQE
ncbi:MAG: hypothetical protein IKY90_08930 [Oscillospiraceae bacterium]|nr:hypothetical protein [Oscillospiraceae bacterium]